MDNSTTHYQTSFRVQDADGKALMRIKASVYGWVRKKEQDHALEKDKNSFFFRCNWTNLYNTHSELRTDTFLSDNGNAWAMHYKEIDKKFGRRRFWISDIGLKKDNQSIIVSVRIAYVWNADDLTYEKETPRPNVPEVIRYILKGNHVFSGRSEFRLLDKPISFKSVGQGKALCDFIQSADRRYPLLVFNSDDPIHVQEATDLAHELTGKCLVAVVANNVGLDEEIRIFLPAEYKIPFGKFRVFFPFLEKHNSPARHRWYDPNSDEYNEQRQGIVNGLLRNHNLRESGAVESVDDIRLLISRTELAKLRIEAPDQQKQLEEFLEEHAKVAADRDTYRRVAEEYSNEVEQLNIEIAQLKWRCHDAQARLDAQTEESPVDVSKLIPTLPSSLAEVAQTARNFFPKLLITQDALDAAEDYSECKSLHEAWEMLWHMNSSLYRLKFEEKQKDLESTFQDATGYALGMSEGRNTKRDSKLMKTRILNVDGRDFDITPHVKHGNREPQLVRIYFAFDEENKRIVVGHIGRHLDNATTKTL